MGRPSLPPKVARRASGRSSLPYKRHTLVKEAGVIGVNVSARDGEEDNGVWLTKKHNRFTKKGAAIRKMIVERLKGMSEAEIAAQVAYEKAVHFCGGPDGLYGKKETK